MPEHVRRSNPDMAVIQVMGSFENCASISFAEEVFGTRPVLQGLRKNQIEWRAQRMDEYAVEWTDIANFNFDGAN